MNIEQIKADIAAYIGHDSAVIIDPQPTINKRGFPDVRGSRNFLGADIIALAADHEALLEKTRWIPCDTRLPEMTGFGNWYQVSVDGYNGHSWVDSAAYYDDHWTSERTANGYDIKIDRDEGRVTAWRELPEPYQPK